MKSVVKHQRSGGGLFCLLFVLLSLPLAASAGEITFGQKETVIPLLQTRTGAYTNVTVTKKTREWVFILHSMGVCNVKVSDLSPEARLKLGYDSHPGPDNVVEAKTLDAKPQATSPLRRFKLEDVRRLAAEWRTNGKEKAAELQTMMNGNPQIVFTVAGILGAVYIFVSICFWFICRKTHSAPGPLVWVPVLQLIPLLRAANMPRVWFFAYFIPVLNIIALIVWSVKIVKTRGKSPWVAFLLILPPTSFFAFLYLAFSRSAPVKISAPEILSLETA
jgi:hypothetical protein